MKRNFQFVVLLLLVSAAALGCMGVDKSPSRDKKVNARLDAIEAAIADQDWDAFASHLKTSGTSQTLFVIDEDGLRDLSVPEGATAQYIAHYFRDTLDASLISFTNRTIIHWKGAKHSSAVGRFDLVNSEGDVRSGRYKLFFSWDADYRVHELGLFFNE